MLTAVTITDAEIREFRDGLPAISGKEFQSGGTPQSPARWHRICHAALGAVNAMHERGLIAAEIETRITDDRGYGYTPPIDEDP